jgi:REP element-mobilizing transposase RayT
MPDHVHFFATPEGDESKSLSSFVGYWKRSTAIRLRRILPCFRWQREFFDHLLRNEESYGQKWAYVRLNPVRGKLVQSAAQWPYQGEVVPLRW